jgi:hypothetical protein
MKWWWWRRLLVCLGLTLAVVAAVLVFARGPQLPSDGKMIRYFQDHRAQFGELLRAFQSDSRDEPALYEPLGVVSAGWSDGRLYVMRSDDDPFDDGPFKEYVYAETQPTPLVQTDTLKASQQTHPVYRAIGDGWYILCGPPGG